MLKLTPNKYEAMKRLSTEEGKIAALAIDQRGALKKMMNALDVAEDKQEAAIVDFKKLVSEELTPFASSILLDPEYGLPAAQVRAENAGLLLAYEKTGYDATKPGRLPDVLDAWSVRELKEQGADGIKFLLYYDVDESEEINHLKKVFVERLGSECVGEDLPFYLELVSYDATIADANSKEYAKVKPHKVIDTMKIFSDERYNVDVLKVEVPVNMNYVEGFAKAAEDVVYTEKEALAFYAEQSQATDLPFIFLSAGVSAELFRDTLRFAKKADSTFNGVLCGRATWKDGVAPFAKAGEAAAREWLKTTGKDNILELDGVIKVTASSWMDKVEVLETVNS
jgi:tagatose 1,6-diphosphate aldolase